MSRPKSGGADAAAEGEEEPKPLMPVFEGEIDDKLTQAVFDKQAMAKSWFKMLDYKKTGQVSKQDFVEGLAEILKDLEGGMDEACLSALFEQTDTDEDGFVSWDEFKSRFVVDESSEENPFLLRNQPPILESPALDILTGIREPFFAYYSLKKKHRKNREKYMDVYKKAEWEEEGAKLNAKKLRSLTEQTAEFLKDQSAKEGVPAPAWIQMFYDTPKAEFAELLAVFDVSSKGKPNLTRFDRWLGLKFDLGDDAPIDYKHRLLNIKVKKGKKSKDGPLVDSMPPPPEIPEVPEGEEAPPPPDKTWHVLECIPNPEFMIEWLKFELFRYIQQTPLLNLNLPCRAGPALANWNFGEAKKWGLENAGGEKCAVFLSDRMKVRWVTLDDEKKPVLYVSFRMEQTGLHFLEMICHGKIHFTKDEEIEKIDHRLVKVYKDGVPQKLPRGTKLDFKDWTQFAEGEDDDASLATTSV